MSSNSKNVVTSAIQSQISQGRISSEVGESVIDQLDDIAIAGSIGVDADQIDSEEVTLVSVVIDASGSMDIFREEVIKAYNDDFLKPLQGAKNAESIHISTWSFSDRGVGQDKLKLIHGYKPCSQCKKLTKNDYAPDGGTPLYQAVFTSMTGLLAYSQTLRDNGTRTKNIIVVLSDGEENASTNISSAKIKKFSRDMLKQENNILSYIYFGNISDGDKYANDIGFPIQHRLNANMSGSEIRRVFGTISASVITTSQSKVHANSLSSNTFFTP